MIQGIYQSAAAADALQQWNDVIARNIAAATTPGFRKDVVAFEGVASGLIDAGGNPAQSASTVGLVPRLQGTVSFQSGEIRRSGDPYEFAIDGEGFFRLQRPDGQFVYTRDGQFRVSPEGRLESKQGFAVMGETGPIQLLPDQGPITVDPDGRVRQGENEIGQLTVYRFRDPAALVRTPGGFAIAGDHPQIPEVSSAARVEQGYLEMSNVSAIREMVNMVAVNNSIQANQRVIQSLDGTMGQAVQMLATI